jgi:nitroimidazol reductase NimA-like FMN-containing flavoprotein (pyridoxamine 5'-phosphate oxidase superfamily)
MNDRIKGKRLQELYDYDRATVHDIVDRTIICHVGLIRDGYPVVIPTIHGRIGDTLYIHGSVAAGNLNDLSKGVDACVTVTIVDGVVVARSLFNSSMNYRSAVIYGPTRVVEDPGERDAALRAITEHVLPGRWEDARPASASEDRQTRIIAIDIEQASAKISDDMPEDDEADMDLDFWAGVIPVSIVAGTPEPDPQLRADIAVPGYIKGYRP